ncbi:MAG: collagen binding domain-containing protein, partial [Acetanaerobacterium sp.]
MKKRRWPKVAIAAVMLMQMFVLSVPLIAEDVSPRLLMTSESLTIFDSDGDIISPETSGEYSDVPTNANISIRYDFSLMDFDPLDGDIEYEYNAGDTFTAALPDELCGISNFPDVTDEILYVNHDPEQPVFGYLTIATDASSGIVTATVTLAEYAESASGLAGWFEVQGSFDGDAIEDQDGNEVSFTLDAQTIIIGFDVPLPEPVEVNVNKAGAYQEDGTILWTVTVTPDAEDTLSDVEVIDQYGSNQSYVADTFRVNETLIADASADLEIDLPGRTITYSFPGVISAEQTISYSTEPVSTAFDAEDGENESAAFHNDATVTVDGVAAGDANATVTLDWIHKSSSVDNEADMHTIHWTVSVNNSAQSISGAYIVDTIPKGLSLVSVELEGVEIALYPGTGSNLNTYTYEEGADDTHILTYYFAGPIAARQTLTYDTKVLDLDYYDSNTHAEFENTASLYWGAMQWGIPSDSDTAEVGVGVLTKTAAGGTVAYNRTTNVIDWTVVVNENKIDIVGAEVLDDIPIGLEYVVNSFEIINIDDSISPVGGDLTYIAAPSDPLKSGTLSYGFGDETTITDTYSITYSTTITDFAPLRKNGTAVYDNEAFLVGGGLEDGSTDFTAHKSFYSQVLTKAVKTNYNYVDRTAEWGITVNRNQIPLENAVLTDEIPAGMVFLPDTFSVTDESGDVVYDIDDLDEYRLVDDDTDITEKDSFTFTFPEESIDEQYVISYQTKVKEVMLLTQGNKTFRNESALSADDMTDVEVSATLSVNNPMIKKTADYDIGADFIEWGVIINSNQVRLNDATIVDELPAGLALDESSVRLYRLELEANGSLTDLGVADSDNYSTTYDEASREFALHFDDLSSAYRLEFVTDIMVETPLDITNKITFLGEG